MSQQAKPIHLFTPTFRIEECLQEVRECLEMGWTGLGYKTLEFEEAWLAYTGLPHAHFLNSASAALDAAFALLKERRGWSDGDEIITTPLTFISTNHAILHSGMQPIFADVDDYLCMDPESLTSRITDRTRAVVFVGIGGNTGQLAEVERICRTSGLQLVLDAAHMAGTRVDGRDPGHMADVVCYSYQAVKNLPTADSGMVCFRDAELDAAVRKYAWLGISKDTYARSNLGTYAWMYDVEYVGHKLHGNSVMAALALVGLRYLDQDNEYRRQLAAWYSEALQDVPGVETVPVAPSCTPSRHLFQVRVANRDCAIQSLQAKNVFPGVHYRSNLEYPMYAQKANSCPRASAASSEILSLPMHLRMSSADVERVTEGLRDYSRNNA